MTHSFLCCTMRREKEGERDIEGELEIKEINNSSSILLHPSSSLFILLTNEESVKFCWVYLWPLDLLGWLLDSKSKMLGICILLAMWTIFSSNLKIWSLRFKPLILLIWFSSVISLWKISYCFILILNYKSYLQIVWEKFRMKNL